MPHIYQEVAALLNKGKPYEALEACMAEISHIHMKDLNRVAQLKGQSFAAERAKTLMWVAAAFAKQEEWEMGRDVARISYTIYPPAANTIENLYLNLLTTAADSESEDGEMSRLALEASVISRIESEMWNAAKSQGGFGPRR